MLITDLSNIKSINIVEREKLESLLKEIELGDSDFINKETAQKLGEGLGATYMLTGSFLIMGETMRIDARLVDVGSGEVVMAEEITGEKDTFFELEKDLVNKLIDTFDISLSKSESRKIKKIQTESFESFNSYSSALVELDEGNVEESIKLLEQATEFDEDFDQAWEKLDILEQKLASLIKARDLGLDSGLMNIISKISNEDTESLAELVQICVALMTSMPWKEFTAFYEDNELSYQRPPIEYLSLSDELKEKVDEINYYYQSKINRAIIFYITIIDIMTSNGLINEPWYTMTMEELMYVNYIPMLQWPYGSYIELYDEFPGVPEVYPDIKDFNGNMIIKGTDINKIIIKMCTKMMEKYPTGMYFTSFEMYYQSAIEREKESRNN
jgi:TolB-like protein